MPDTLRLATALLLAAHLGAQSKAPTLTSTLKLGRTLQVSVTHEARTWDDRASKRKLGTFQAKQAVFVGGEAIDKGTFTLALSTNGSDDDWRLQLLPKSKKAKAVAWSLEAGEHEARPLRIAFRAGDGDMAHLDVEFGAMRASLPVASLKAVEAMLSQDSAIRAIDAMLDKANIDKKASNWRTKMPEPMKATFDPKRRYFWNLKTSEGRIVIRFMPDVAPLHVSSTIALTRTGFYDGLRFHRVVTGFMAQGGCSNGTGTGSCGFTYGGEFRDDVIHDRPGLLSMANSGPGTDGSQFFITFGPAAHLDGKHTIFGEVVDGMKTVRRLEKAGSEGGKPSKELGIESATVSIR